ncbi:MAG: hypothetical protein RIG62_14505 [Cyclobacteriaceae bacterium]
MNPDELKPQWRHYTSSVAATEERPLEELDALLPPERASFFMARPFFFLKNVAMYAFIIVCCGGC